jgi:hypothetical protein
MHHSARTLGDLVPRDGTVDGRRARVVRGRRTLMGRGVPGAGADTAAIIRACARGTLRCGSEAAADGMVLPERDSESAGPHTHVLSANAEGRLRAAKEALGEDQCLAFLVGDGPVDHLAQRTHRSPRTTPHVMLLSCRSPPPHTRRAQQCKPGHWPLHWLRCSRAT